MEESWGAKPSERRTSASSRTSRVVLRTTATWASSMSSRRPQVATSSAREEPSSSDTCSSRGPPPYTAAARSPPLTRCSERATDSVCTASSRVGTRTSARGPSPGRVGRLCAAACAKAGSRYASVLPEPVGARQSRSRPARATGYTCAWTGDASRWPSETMPLPTSFGSDGSPSDDTGGGQAGGADAVAASAEACRNAQAAPRLHSPLAQKLHTLRRCVGTRRCSRCRAASASAAAAAPPASG
mmetsp:Transcript_8258/g.27087  ORF Transcript_8258/g.27087 Transcript_8258/m.27087 type:complete len:243 (+) Transcript_8258:163-891(+)